MAKEFSFDDLNKDMNKYSKLGDMIADSNISKIDSFIHTGNYHLNACLTGDLFKGIPNNRSISLSGSSGTGKTFLTLNICKAAQEEGYTIIYYDSENAVDLDLIEKFGIDPAKFRYEPCNTVQDFRTQIVNLTDTLIEKQRSGFSIPKIMVILDSVGNLATEKEINDAKSGSDKADMTRAKTLKSIFRIIMTRFAEVKIPFIFTNHTYSSQSFIPQEIAGGGTGPEYAASIILFLSKAQLKEKESKVGIVVTAKPNKNRFAMPNPIKFHIHYQKGMNPYVGMEQYMSWDIGGIAKGKVYTQKEFDKMKPGVTKDNIAENSWQFIEEIVDEETGEVTTEEKTLYAELKDSARNYVVKHLGKAIPAGEVFTDKVFTREILEEINEKCIKPKFAYSTTENDDDAFEILDGDEASE